MVREITDQKRFDAILSTIKSTNLRNIFKYQVTIKGNFEAFIQIFPRDHGRRVIDILVPKESWDGDIPLSSLVSAEKKDSEQISHRR